MDDSASTVETFDEWNKEYQYSRCRLDYDTSYSSERRTRSRSRDRRGRSINRFRQRSSRRDRRGRPESRDRRRSKSRYHQRSKSRDHHERSKSRDRRLSKSHYRQRSKSHRRSKIRDCRGGSKRCDRQQSRCRYSHGRSKSRYTATVPLPETLQMPYQNNTQNLNDYRSSVNVNVQLPTYQQSNFINATITYGQNKQNLQSAQSASRIDISNSHLDKAYRNGDYSIPSLYSTNSASSLKYRIQPPDIHTTENDSATSSKDQQSNVRDGYDSADLQYNSGKNIDQRPNRDIVTDSSSVIPNEQSTVEKEEEDMESIIKTLISPSGSVNPRSFIALINLCGKKSNDDKSNEIIEAPTASTNPPDTNEQNDINLMTTTKAKKIVAVKKSIPKRMSWSSYQKSKRNSQSTKSGSPNASNNPMKLKDTETKSKLKANVVKPKRPYEHLSTICHSVKRCRNTAISYAGQDVDSPEPNRATRSQMTKKHDVILHKLQSSDSNETYSSTTVTTTNKKNRKIGAVNVKYKSGKLHNLSAASSIQKRRILSNQNRKQFTKVNEPSNTEPSTIKNNNPEWHCMNPRLECLHCNKNTGISLANHYVNKHPDCEVFPCRLSPDIAEFLRNTTQEHKCERRKPEDAKLASVFRQRCYFCDKFKVYTKSSWLKHYAVHTGCYEFYCKYCSSTFSRKKYHACVKNKDCIKKLKYPPFHRGDGIVYGYVCDLCNFTRFEQSEIEKHLRCEHECKFDGKFSELVLLTFPRRKKKHELKAEEEALKLADIKASTESKSLDPLTWNDDIVIVIDTDDDDDDQIDHRPKDSQDTS